MKPLTIPELAALPADERADAAWEQHLKFCLQRGFIGKGRDNFDRRMGFIAGWDMATETMVWLHMQQKAKELQEQANEPR